MMKALDEDKIEYKEYTAADSNEIQTVTTTACNECDVIYVPTDNTMASSAETIKNVVAYEILVNDKKTGDMEIEFADTFTKMYNEENCKALNLTVPEGYEKLETASE